MFKTLWILFCYRLRRLFSRDHGQAVATRKRSGKWPAVRAAHLAKHPACAVTGDTSDVEVHHVLAFDLHPELELEPANLITLSNKSISPHLLFGHLGNFRTVNPFVRENAAALRLLIEHRDRIETAAELLSKAKAAPKPKRKPRPRKTGGKS